MALVGDSEEDVYYRSDSMKSKREVLADVDGENNRGLVGTHKVD